MKKINALRRINHLTIAKKTEAYSKGRAVKDSVFYWLKEASVQNYGDFIAAFLLEKLFYPIGLASNGIHIIGSVVDDMFVPEMEIAPGDPIPQPVVFWGCGVRSKDGLSENRHRLVEILTVRGPISASELRLGVQVPTGDPVFLLPALHTVRPVVHFQDKTVCVPHFHDRRSDEALLIASGCDIILRPNIKNDIDEIKSFIDRLCSAKFVLSAALHGALTAAAFQRPFAFWDSGHIDTPLKWKDAAASLKISDKLCAHLSEARPHYETKIRPLIQLPSLWRSLAVAPLLLRPEGLLKALRHELSQKVGREDVSHFDEFIDVFTFHKGHAERFAGDIRKQFDEQSSRLSREIANLKQQSDLSLNAAYQELEKTRLENEILIQKNKSAQLSVERAIHERDIVASDLNATLKKLNDLYRIYDTTVLQRDASILAQNAANADRSLAYSKWRAGQADNEALGVRLAQTEAALRMLEGSTAWKMTWPLRRTVTHSPLARKMSRRMAKATWWMATLQFARLRQRSPILVKPITEDESRESLNFNTPVVLIIDSVYPRPDQDSGSIDAVNFIDAFMGIGYKVIFIADAAFSEKSSAREKLEKSGVYCITSDEYSSVEQFLEAHGKAINVAFLSRVYSGGRHIEKIKSACGNTKVIFNTVDLHHVREERQARIEGDIVALNNSFRTRERELAIARLADATIVVSEAEKELLDRTIPGTLTYVVKLAREVPGRINSFAHRTGIGFIGGYRHTPNVDAVNYFLDSIWPLVRVKLPNVEFRAMGADMPDQLYERSDPSYRAIGYVSDLAMQMEMIRLTVAPLRFGAGVKGKVASSLAHGVPCVSTSLGAEGMGLSDGENVAVADNPEDFARRIIEIYSDERTWTRLSDMGIDFIREEYSFEKTKGCLRIILNDIRA